MIQPFLLNYTWLPVEMASAGNPSRDPTALAWKDLKAGSALLRDKRIVIVEDEGLTQLQLRKICSLAGMQVVGTAVNGAEGVQRVLQTQPDLVLMDIKMPILDGLNAAALILRQLSVCVVMLSAYDLEDYKDQARSIGTAGYLYKPVNASTLIPQLEAAYQSFQSTPGID